MFSLLYLGKYKIGIDVKVLQSVTLKLLDMVYLQYSEIYSRLHQIASGGSPVTQKLRFVKKNFKGHNIFIKAAGLCAVSC